MSKPNYKDFTGNQFLSTDKINNSGMIKNIQKPLRLTKMLKEKNFHSAFDVNNCLNQKDQENPLD